MNVELDETSIFLAKYNSLKYSFKKDGSKFSQYIINVLETLSNPFEYFCFCVKLDKDSSQKIDSFTSQFILEFEKFFRNKNERKLLLTSSIQIKAYEIFKILKISVVKNAVVRAFLLSSIPHLIVPLLKMELQKKNSAANVAASVTKLQYQSHFDLNELVVPLFLQDKIGEIEKLLDSSKELQKKFLSLLDGIVGNEIQISDLLNSCKVREIKGQKSPKIIYKLGLRLMKKYNINTELCPHIMHRNKLSSLRYLFLRCYQQNELTIDSLILFAQELSENSISLKTQTLDLFIEYLDAFGGLLFSQKDNVPEEYIPHQISYLLKDSKEMENERMRHQAMHYEKLNIEDFYTLSIPFAVCQIKTVQEFNIALHKLQSYSIIGIDTEWKPTLQFDKEEELMLLQVATMDRVYLFDMLYLQNLLSLEHWEKIGEIFSDTKITKLTYSFAGDKKCLGGCNTKLKEHLKNMANIIDLNETKKFLMDYYPQFFCYVNNKPNNFCHKGLSEMVYFCFGKPLNKMEQCSYWSVRPLSQNQVVYAALDAFCLIDIYNYLNRMSAQLNLDWQSLKPDGAKETNTQKSVKFKNSKCNNSTKPKTGNGPLKKEPKFKVCASSFKVVCDSMLQGLGKLLRSCNIDTEILASSDYHEKCIEFFEKEERVILTRGNVYHQIRKHVPKSYILYIRNDNVKMQLDEVIKQFGVIIEDQDIFARCCECNSNVFMTFDPKLLSKAKSFKGRPTTAPKWVAVDDGKSKFNVQDVITDKGLKVRVEEVPYGVLNKVAVVYVCGRCGKCYWDGSHMERMRGNLSHVIRH